MLIANVLQPLIDVCREVLEFWHGVIGDFDGSWGVAIILLTFTVRLFILPLTFKTVKGMQRMQQFQPEIKRIQERYKGDRQRMNQEVMAFYQKEKINPFASCLPLLLQLPFFLALFSLLRSDPFQEDIAGNEGFLFIDNLAEKATDPVVLGVLIVVYVGTQLISGLVTSISADPQYKWIMLGLPLVFAFLIPSFETGLILYWITTNTWTIGQQLLVRKLYPKPEPRELSDETPKPARGKPVPQPSGGDGAGAKPAGKRPAKAAAKSKSGAVSSGNGGPAKAPPSSPRKKKKRSGRRR